MTRRPDRATLAARINRYLVDDNNQSVTATLTRRLFGGEAVSAAVVRELGGSGGLLGILMGDLELIGFQVDRRRVPSAGFGPATMHYRLKASVVNEGLREEITRAVPTPIVRVGRKVKRYDGPQSLDEAGWHNTSPPGDAAARRAITARSVPVEVERPGVTYPTLGASLRVVGLALGDDGLIMVLANGDTSWQVKVLGHVGREVE